MALKKMWKNTIYLYYIFSPIPIRLFFKLKEINYKICESAGGWILCELVKIRSNL